MKTILISCYAVSPYKGSEDATGWNIVLQIIKYYKVILITRKNNIPDISNYIRNSSNEYFENLEFYGYDLWKPICDLKKKLSGKSHVVYYHLWQYNIVSFIRSSGFKFDLAHNLNFHSDSHPTFLWKLGKPTFWGPIGHHQMVPLRYLKHYSYRDLVKDRSYGLVKCLSRKLNPYYYISIKKVNKIYGVNMSVQQSININLQKLAVVPAIGASFPSKRTSRDSDFFNVLCVGRFDYLKGFDISIKSFSVFLSSLPMPLREKVKLIVIGKGKDESKLQSLSSECIPENNIDWVDWVSTEELNKYYLSSHVFLTASHEGAGMVVTEAMSFGIPCVCFDNFGPGETVGDSGIKVKYGKYEYSILRMAVGLRKLYFDKEYWRLLSDRSFKRIANKYSWEKKVLVFIKDYKKYL